MGSILKILLKIGCEPFTTFKYWTSEVKFIVKMYWIKSNSPVSLWMSSYFRKDLLLIHKKRGEVKM